MRVQLRITRELLDQVRRDLVRPHIFASERVGFLFCRFGELGRGGLIVLACDYSPVADGDYVDDSRFGALIGPGAFRAVLQRVLTDPVGAFHVHLHAHRGVPSPSGIDRRETGRFVPDFFHARPDLSHGAVVLSLDRLSARIWLRETGKPIDVSEVRVVGAPMLSFGGKA